ncbi:Tripartite DNA replication factor [Halocaridina rubra]|uniref:DNA replication ATP-dependent helicase/nuclease n=1 Tax=Halocaridina rubra TaxID=373956 RepID=A0AAN9AGV8_HALRR
MSFNFTNLARLLIDDPRVAKLRALIVDRIQPSFKKGLPADIIAKGKSILRQLNKSQQRAVLRTLMANDYSLLKGFPGTGKTSTIVALVQLMLALGYSVLLTSYTHSAVDNILLKLKSCEVDFLRLGKTSRIHPDIKEYSDERLTSVFRDVKSLADFYDDKLVVATTCLGTNHVLFSRRIFDFCIVDEASQVLQPAVLGPLFQAHRFVLVGDPQQLPPLIQSSEARDLGMGESLFARLDSLGATSCLTQQYRMNGHIMKLANLLMYDGQLQCANSALETATITLPNYTNEECTTTFPGWIKRAASSNLENSVVFLDTCGCAPEDQNSNVSAKEASLILVLIISFLKAGLNIDDIGVITPYRDQVKYLRNLITKNVTNGSRVEVNTVDQYQGRDKSVILYSCVRSATSKPKNGDILQDEHRLNVAITRAKYKLILIGDISTLQNYKPFKTLISLFMESSQVYTLRDGIDGFHWSDFNPYCN